MYHVILLSKKLVCTVQAVIYACVLFSYAYYARGCWHHINLSHILLQMLQ